MAYNELLANRIREQLQEFDELEEKEMMGGLSFMLHNKMCVGVIQDELVCRIDPAKYEDALEKQGCRPMDFTGKPMKGWVMINDTGMKNATELNDWISLAIEYNKYAKVSKKRKK